MRKTLLKLLILTILCPFIAFADFTLVDVDENGMDKISQVSKSDYKLIMKEVLSGAHLIANEEKRVKVNHFRLKRISIGVGAKGDIGFGPYRSGGSVQQKFYFERELK